MRAALPIWVKRLVQHRRVLLRGKWNVGQCPVCEGPTLFLVLGEPLRAHYRCLRCWSNPRHRAFILVVNERFPSWRAARIHEFAPQDREIGWFQVRCPGYSFSQFWPDVPPGAERAGVRCEDLGHLTFADGEFDLVISQDVFEHLPDPGAAATEIRRVLAPGGAHVFTVPIYPHPTRIRAEVDAQGGVSHLLPPDYHGNPAMASGALVFREWGADIVDFIREASSLETEIVDRTDRRRGVVGGWHDVLVTTKFASAQGDADESVSSP